MLLSFFSHLFLSSFFFLFPLSASLLFLAIHSFFSSPAFFFLSCLFLPTSRPLFSPLLPSLLLLSRLPPFLFSFPFVSSSLLFLTSFSLFLSLLSSFSSHSFTFSSPTLTLFSFPSLSLSSHSLCFSFPSLSPSLLFLISLLPRSLLLASFHFLSLHLVIFPHLQPFPPLLHSGRVLESRPHFISF